MRRPDEPSSKIAVAVNASGPIHGRISEDIRLKIFSGELMPGQQLPSENSLAAHYGVARGTVRQALATLRASGTLTGSQGKPLAVRGPHMTQPLSHLISFSSWALALGKRPAGRVVSFATVEADADTAQALGVAPGSTVYRLIRLRLADDQPMMIERTTFAPQVGDLLKGIDLEHQSIYAELARRGIVFASARHVISAVAATNADASLLGIASWSPLLRIRRLAFSQSGLALEWSDDRYLANLVDFTIENTTAGPGVVRRMALREET